MLYSQVIQADALTGHVDGTNRFKTNSYFAIATLASLALSLAVFTFGNLAWALSGLSFCAFLFFVLPLLNRAACYGFLPRSVCIDEEGWLHVTCPRFAWRLSLSEVTWFQGQIKHDDFISAFSSGERAIHIQAPLRKPYEGRTLCVSVGGSNHQLLELFSRLSVRPTRHKVYMAELLKSLLMCVILPNVAFACALLFVLRSDNLGFVKVLMFLAPMSLVMISNMFHIIWHLGLRSDRMAYADRKWFVSIVGRPGLGALAVLGLMQCLVGVTIVDAAVLMSFPAIGWTTARRLWCDKCSRDQQIEASSSGILHLPALSNDEGDQRKPAKHGTR